MIACVGCSWTYGLGVKDNESYPAHLQDYLDIPVINAGFLGSSVMHSIWTAYKLLKEYDIKIVLLQLSTYDRWTSCIDGRTNFIEDRPTSGAEEYIYDSDELQSPYKRVFNVSADYYYHLLTQAQYLKHKDGSEPKDIAMSYLYENVIYSNFHFSQLNSQIDMLNSHCEYNNSKLVVFNWIKQPSEFTQNKLSVYETFGDKYIIDNGYHYNSKGLKRVATEYVYPLIQKFL